MPGCLAVYRFTLAPLKMSIGGELKTIVAEGEPKYSAVYELESADVLTSPGLGGGRGEGPLAGAGAAVCFAIAAIRCASCPPEHRNSREKAMKKKPFALTVAALMLAAAPALAQDLPKTQFKVVGSISACRRIKTSRSRSGPRRWRKNRKARSRPRSRGSTKWASRAPKCCG